jgi:hypothetical protein
MRAFASHGEYTYIPLLRFLGSSGTMARIRRYYWARFLGSPIQKLASEYGR